MVIPKHIPFVFIFCFACSLSVAQKTTNIMTEDKYRAVNWNVNNGLAHDEVRCILRDAYGFLWFGTDGGGLSRFDGSTFKNYFYNPAQRGTVCGPAIFGLVEDSLHNIWIGTNKGLSHYNRNADTLANFYPASTPSFISNFIVPFWATSDEVLCYETGLLITSYNIHSFSKKTIIRLTTADSVSTDTYSIPCSIFDRESNSIWMLRDRDRGLLEISLTTGKKVAYDFLAGENMRYDRKRNSIWINTDVGLIEFNLKEKKAHHVEALKELEKQNAIGHIGVDQDPAGRVWFYTFLKGILIYDPNDESVRQVIERDSALQKKIAESTACIYCDRDGMVWTGSWLREGVNQVVPFTRVVKSYDKDISNLRGLHTNNIYNIIRGKHNEMWMGTGDDLVVFNTQTDTFTTFHEQNLPGFKGKYIVPISVDTIRKKAWLAAVSSHSFYEMDLLTRKCERITFKDSINKTIIPEFREGVPVFSKNGCIIAATYNQRQVLFIISKDSAVAREFLSFPAGTINYGLPNPTPVAGDLLFLRRADASGNLTYNGNEGKWKRIKNPMDSISWTIIKYNRNDESYWVVGPRKLIHYDHNLRFLKEYNTEDGLPHDEIYGLIPDDRGNIWFNTYRSIYQLNVMTDQVSILSEKDGMLSVDLRDLGEGIAKDDNGDLYFTTAGIFKGFKRISPRQFFSPQSFIYIKSIAIKEYVLPPSTGANNVQRLELKHFQNRIIIETGTIDLYSQGKNHIRYKLDGEGRKENWQYAPANHTIRYEELPAGTYTLRIQASNVANEFNGPEKVLLINISPPFWQTWWFRIFAILFVMTIFYGFIQYRSRNLKKRNIQLEQKVTERTNELNKSLTELKTTQDQLIHSEKMASLGELTSGIAHEIKNPLNFINNFSELNLDLMAEIEEEKFSRLDENTRAEVAHIIKTMRKNSEKINHHGKRVDEIVKSMLQHSRVGNLTKEPVNVNALCEESLKLAYHGFKAKEKTFNASFEMHFDTDLPGVLAIPQDLGRVLLNLINNAFYAVNEKKNKLQPVSHGATGAQSSYTPMVTVSTKKSGSKIVITVSDNGTGIPQKIVGKIFQPFFTTKPTGEGTGLGLSMAYDIITKSHGGELFVKSKEGTGSDFEIVLPV
jgi:signal transduction histidine kinase/ligand-binding sensor domain-containing protein